MVTLKARPYYASMADDLLAFYNTEGKYLNDMELFIRIAKKFGDRMLIDVCPFFDLDQLECAVGAVHFMKELAGVEVHNCAGV